MPRTALWRRLRHLPSGLAVSAVLLVGGVAVVWPWRGGVAAAGVAAGVALVAVGYALSSFVVAYVDLVAPRQVMLAALGTYVVKFVLLGVALAALARSGWAGLAPMGVAVIVTVICWSTAQAWWTIHAKIPYVELES